jgi:hypothetical protein
MKAKIVIALLVVLCASHFVFAQSSGPAKGNLVLTGGDFGKGVIERFVALAGGPEANFVYVPTAASSLRLPSGFIFEPPDADIPAANTAAFEQELAKLFGVRHVTLLHTRSRASQPRSFCRAA